MSQRTYRVVITGMGSLNPVGNDIKSTWQGIVNGRSGISAIPEHFNMTEYPVKVAGRVTNEQALLNAIIPAKQHSKIDRFIQLGLAAGYEAMHDAGLSQTFPADRTRFGVYMGVGIGGLASITQAVRDFDGQGSRRVSPFAIPKTVSNMLPGWLSLQWNLQGSLTAITNACASSTDAVGLAFRQIRHGYADYMLAGGSECPVTPIGIVAFGNMRALSTWTGEPTQACRPFDRQRSGFVMGEGAAVLVLEREDLARARNAKIYAEVVGYGATSDAYHITSMHPEGLAAARAMNEAIADAGIAPADIGYINAHGTGTQINDITETVAIKKVFGPLADPSHESHVCVSSTKSMTGHLLGAAGALEASLTALALRDGIIPPTINLNEPDESCSLDYAPHQAKAKYISYALSNSFGFGGGNAVLAFKRWE